MGSFWISASFFLVGRGDLKGGGGLIFVIWEAAWCGKRVGGKGGDGMIGFPEYTVAYSPRVVALRLKAGLDLAARVAAWVFLVVEISIVLMSG